MVKGRYLFCRVEEEQGILFQVRSKVENREQRRNLTQKVIGNVEVLVLGGLNFNKKF